MDDLAAACAAERDKMDDLQEEFDKALQGDDDDDDDKTVQPQEEEEIEDDEEEGYEDWFSKTGEFALLDAKLFQTKTCCARERCSMDAGFHGLRGYIIFVRMRALAPLPALGWNWGLGMVISSCLDSKE